ncbi:MAG TPA: hypothetical protein VD997_13480 [Phycisphaerales bacterium]|nr:hypothetical protein [Phycisphaerales bacterium]
MRCSPRVIAVSVLLAAAATGADAAIIHRVFSTPLDADNNSLDLTGDGIHNVGFFMFGPGPFQVHEHRLLAHSFHPTSDLVSPRPGFGATIGPASTFASDVTLGHSQHEHITAQDGPILWSHWMPGSPTTANPFGYIGLRTYDSQAQPHFAWARYELVSLIEGQPLVDYSYFRARIHEVAWESQPGTPITVGAIPAPSALAPLLLAQLIARRRR